MRAKRKYPPQSSETAALHDQVAPITPVAEAEPMVRTQIYLTRSEYDFLQTEAKRRGEPMAAVLRSFIDEKRTVPEEEWNSNPLLQPPVDDPTYVPVADGSVNHDHYIAGGPKKYKKVRGKWMVKTPVL